MTVPLVLAEAASVRLVVYDVLGRAVAVLADGPYPAGRHALNLDAGARLAPGAYLVHAVVQRSDGRPLVQTQRLTILR